MDGTEPKPLAKDLSRPEFLTIDLQKEELFFSTSGIQNAKIESMNLDGSNRREILSSAKNHPINRPTGIAVMDRRLYYLDRTYEKVVKVRHDKKITSKKKNY